MVFFDFFIFTVVLLFRFSPFPFYFQMLPTSSADFSALNIHKNLGRVLLDVLEQVQVTNQEIFRYLDCRGRFVARDFTVNVPNSPKNHQDQSPAVVLSSHAVPV